MRDIAVARFNGDSTRHCCSKKEIKASGNFFGFCSFLCGGSFSASSTNVIPSAQMSVYEVVMVTLRVSFKTKSPPQRTFLVTFPMAVGFCSCSGAAYVVSDPLVATMLSM